MTINQLNNTCQNDFTVTSGDAIRRYMAVINSSNAAGAYALVAASVGGAGANNPIYQATTAAAGAPTWTWGLDNAHGQKWALGYANDVGTANDAIQVYPTGEVNMPLQPAFSVYVSVAIPNVTGDGTLYQIAYDTAILNRGNCYDFVNNYFKAPVTGLYYLSFTSIIQNCVHLTACATGLVAGAIDYGYSGYNSVNSTGYGTSTGSVIAYLNQNETAYVQVVSIDTGGKVDGIYGFIPGGGVRNFFTGCLLN